MKPEKKKESYFRSNLNPSQSSSFAVSQPYIERQSLIQTKQSADLRNRDTPLYDLLHNKPNAADHVQTPSENATSNSKSSNRKSSTKEKKRVHSVARTSPWDDCDDSTDDLIFPKPKRPRTAYNFFVQSERAKIVEEMKQKQPSHSSKEPPEDVNFMSIGKTLGKRWHNLNTATKFKYESLAKKDVARYTCEMRTFYTRGYLYSANESRGVSETAHGMQLELPKDHMEPNMVISCEVGTGPKVATAAGEQRVEAKIKPIQQNSNHEYPRCIVERPLRSYDAALPHAPPPMRATMQERNFRLSGSDQLLTRNQSYVAAGNCGSLLGLPGNRNGGPSSFNGGLKRSELLDDVSRFSTQQITRLASKPTLLPDDAILALSNTTGNHFNPLGAQFPDPLQIMLSKELFRPSQLPAVAAEAISEVSGTKYNRDASLFNNTPQRQPQGNVIAETAQIQQDQRLPPVVIDQIINTLLNRLYAPTTRGV